MSEAKLTIEITSINQFRESWYNQCLGGKFEVTEKRTFYELTEKGLEKLNQIQPEICYAIVPKQFASLEGQVIVSNNIQTFPLVQKHIKFITEVRRFVVTEDVNIYNRQGEVTSSIVTKGQVFEERYDKPNQIIQVDEEGRTLMHFELKELNKSTLLLPAFECNETIPAKESRYFTLRKKAIESEYVKKMRSIELMQSEIANLEFLLDVKKED
jgi:hypothetical protein